jgi:ethanolamine-phosphate cytidylyltransferase
MTEDCQSFSFAASLLLWCESLVLHWSESTLVVSLVFGIRQVLDFLGAPDDFGPSSLDTCRSIIAIILTLIFYFVLFGNRHQRRRRLLARELQVAQAELAWLQEKLRLREEGEDDDNDNRGKSKNRDNNKKKKREIRIFMDGAFDLMHYGHMNAFRLGQSLGTHLVVGVNSDESITQCKGAPLMNDEERMTMVESCKFVDEVVRDCPYIMNKEYLEYVIETYKIDYVIHGDDPCIVDGKDVYEEAKKCGKFRSIPRTEGVSTTDIVGRMLLLTKTHHTQEGESVLGSQSRFLTTSRMLQLFSKNVKAPESWMRVIYIDGTWDLFHPGHVKILKAAKEVRE